MKGKFIKLLDALKKANDLEDRYDDVSKKVDGLRKFAKADAKEREKLTRDMLGIDSYLDGVVAEAGKVRADLKKIEQERTEWPEADCGDIFMSALAANDKYGPDSPQAKKAWKGYLDALKAFDKMINAELSALNEMKSEIPMRLQAAQGLAKIARQLEVMFELCLKLPLGTMLQATFFTANQEAGVLAADGEVIADTLRNIRKRVEKEIAEGEEIEANNATWIAFAGKAAGYDVKRLQANAKAKKPK